MRGIFTLCLPGMHNVVVLCPRGPAGPCSQTDHIHTCDRHITSEDQQFSFVLQGKPPFSSIVQHERRKVSKSMAAWNPKIMLTVALVDDQVNLPLWPDHGHHTGIGATS